MGVTAIASVAAPSIEYRDIGGWIDGQVDYVMLPTPISTAHRVVANRPRRHFALTLKHEFRIGLIRRASGRQPLPSPRALAGRGWCAEWQRRWRQRSALRGTAKHR